MKSRSVAAWILALLVFTVSCANATEYSIRFLDAPFVLQDSSIAALNDFGQVIGYGQDLSGKWHSLFWDVDGSVTEVNPLPDRPRIDLIDVNNHGLVFGMSGGPAFPWPNLNAILWSKDKGITMLDLPPGWDRCISRGINDCAKATGWYVDKATDHSEPFYWTASTGMVALPTPGSYYGSAEDINNHGAIVGHSGGKAVVWNPDGTVKELMSFPFGPYGSGKLINDAGQVVGGAYGYDTYDKLLLWNPDGSRIPLGTLGGTWAWAYSMNNLGQVGGVSAIYPGGPGYSFIWTVETGMQEFFLPAGYHANLNDVNNVGQIVGEAYDPATSKLRPFIGTPTGGHPPDCRNAIASPAVIWPPKARMIPIEITGVTDPNGDPISIVIDNITQDEPVLGEFDDTAPDAAVIGTGTAVVRAERSGSGNGRVYAILFMADDGSGGRSKGLVKVQVPHSRKSACIDDGQLYDATRE